MLEQITIDRVIDAANIVDVVSEYVTLRRAGANYKGLCPFHEDKTPSFHVSPSKGICKCFACGEGGNAVHFIMKMEQLSYIEAIKFLGKKYGIEVEDRDLTPEQKQSINERESMFAVNEWASKYFNSTLFNTEDGKAIGQAYFRSRGFRDDIIEKFRLGFALDKWDALAKEAVRKGYKEEFLLKTGLCYRRDNGQLNDKYRGRVIFPWFNVSGKIVAFGGRVLDSRTKGVAQKYINSSESPIFNKSYELYGLYQAKKQIVKDDLVYMVEGYTDVISMHQCGVENVVANSGTALNEAQIRLLHRFTSNITLLYDGDEAGVHAALRGTDMLLSEGMNVKILLLPDGDDPDSFAKKHNATEFRQYISDHQTDFIIFKANLLLKDAGRDPIKRANLIKDIVRSISVIPEEIVRSAYVHECAELMQINEDILLRETTKNRREALEALAKEKQRERDRAATKEAQAKTDNNQQPNVQDAALSQSTPTAPLPTDEHSSMPTPEELDAMNAAFYDSLPPEANAPSTAVNTTEQSIYSTLPKENQKIYGLEKAIMSLVVRYGEQPVEINDSEGGKVTMQLMQFVNENLLADELQLQTPMYSQMLNDAIEHSGEEDFTVCKYFQRSPNFEVSQEAVNLLSDKYQLSKGQQMPSEKELAPEYIVHLMLDYKYTIIDEELKSCQKMLQAPEVVADADKCSSIMQKYLQLSSVQRLIAKQLGDRVFRK